VTVLVYAIVGAAALGLAQRAWMGARVARGSVTGRAAAAIGDSGVFASPVLPPGVHPVLAHADAESAAVAMGYWFAPSYQVMGVPYYKVRPTQRRHFCGRSYYVRSVVALPDPEVPSVTGDIVMTWGPAWVMPVCNDAGIVRTTVLLADAPTRMRVIQGDQPGDVPELVNPPGTFGRIGSWQAKYFPDWERGIGMTPETAVAVATARLAGTGARVTEVPEAFMLVMPPHEAVPRANLSRPFVQTHACPRWRLTLDQAVALRGMASGKVVDTRTVYVARGDSGCDGIPTLQIPQPTQPTTLPFLYGVRSGKARDSVVPPRNGRPAALPPPDMRWMALRVAEPIWFEEARLRR
jgi:hypothetical protein